LIGSIEIIGSREKAVAIIGLPKGWKGDLEEIAKEVMKRHKNVRSVLVRASGREGEYRIRKYKLIMGDENTEVIHKEHGYRIKVDPVKAYFSAREGDERQRVAKQVKPHERVLVMFAGVGPYCIAIAKKQPLVEVVVGVEKNPDAYRYFIENIRLNKLERKVKAYLGDVREVCPKMRNEFNRVVMPLPLGAELFVDLAVDTLKEEGGIINIYGWGPERDPFGRLEERVREEIERKGRKCEILGRRIVSSYAPRIYKVRLDVLIG